MALKYTDKNYYDSSENTDGTGYYQFTTLKNIIDTFMATKVGAKKMISECDRTDVEFHAQRAIQEFSYDVFRPVAGWEENLDAKLSIKAPQNLVDVLGVFWVDDNGYRHPIQENRFIRNNNSVIKDDENDYIYDDEDELIYASESKGIDKLTNPNNADRAQMFAEYYAGAFSNDALFDRYYSYYGRRFGLNPETSNSSGSYVYDSEIGVFFFDGALLGQTVNIDYLSDGLDKDKSKVQVHKFCEDAIYDYISMKLIQDMRDMPLYEKQLIQKRAKASKRNAKLRLSKTSPQEIWATLRNKGKIIKH